MNPNPGCLSEIDPMGHFDISLKVDEYFFMNLNGSPKMLRSPLKKKEKKIDYKYELNL